MALLMLKKEENPPNSPQIRPIENYWGILKMKVYEGNWSDKDREALIRRIKMFEKLKQKVHDANENGLSSLN